MRIFAYSRLITVATCAMVASRANAQRVIGVVRDSASRYPLPGAVVTLLDSTGGVARRTITNADGQFRLSVVGDVRRVQIIRIGYRPRTLALAITSPANDTTIDVAMPALPTLLDAVTVLEQPNCSRRADRSAALALWEQARAGLLASVVAREANPARVHELLYDRTLDREGKYVESQSVSESSFVASRAAASIRTAADFAAAGYLEENAQRRRYHAPDADVLLDSAFAATHCFSLHEKSATHDGELGLNFAPVRDREDVVDVSGVLWIDRQAPALRSLEFRFTGVEPAAAGVGTGGSLRFREMRNGVVMVERWNLHVPHLSRPLIRIGSRNERARDNARRITGMHDLGGELADAAWPDSTIWHASLGDIHGTVVSAVSGHPVPRTTLRLDNTTRITVTDSLGRFAFSRLLPGPYTLIASDTLLAAFGIAQATVTIVAVRDSMTEVTLSLPDQRTVIAQRCLDAKKGDKTFARSSERLLLGRVVLADGRPAANAEVSARWFIHDASAVLRQLKFSGTTDSTGSFEICGLPDDREVAFGVQRDSLVAVDTSVTFADAPIVGLALQLVSPSIARLPAYRRRVLGVFDEASGEPLRDVELSNPLSGAELGRTTTAGTAGLAALPLGQTTILLQKPGYVTRAVVVNVSPSDNSSVTVTMRGIPDRPSTPYDLP